MYAIFEEVIGPQPLVSFPNAKGSHPFTEEEDQGVVVTTTDQNPEVNPDHCEASAHYASSRSRPKRSPIKQQRIYGSSSSSSSYQNRHSSTLPRSNRRRLYSGSIDSTDLDDTASISSSNPLLDTISVLAYDPPDDSDDYYDLHDDEFDQCKRDKNSKSTSGAPEGDRDSIGYAGSSSIDSGYKSFCPTPEIPDSSIYGPDASRQANSYTGYYAEGSSASQGRNGKPRIMMGTKVISRQGHVSPLRESPGSRRSDSSLYDVNLDHLMYLRQSLLSAIQKCEFSKSSSSSNAEPSRTDTSHVTTEKCSTSNPVNDERYLDNPPPKSSQPSYTKTVRFNTDVKVTTVNSSQPASDGSDINPCRTSDGANAEQKVQSKSILKDPLCANLRSQLEAGSVDCTLEEEIDSLLYGRAEFYDLESVDDFPCSYVTMIEEKYRSGKTSIAKVRKLKGEKSQDQSSKTTPAVPENGTEPSNPVQEDDSRSQKATSKDSSTTSPTVSISKTAKCRFTEVARCMLEIIEDLQMKKLQPDSAKDSEAVQIESATVPSTPSEEQKSSNNDGGLDSKSSSSECYASAAEYHVYEEIDYDFLSGTVPPLPKLQDTPPPLPVRPNLMVIKADGHHDPQQKRVPSPPPRKTRCPLKRNPCPSNDEGSTEVRNRPKQRGNLYCLFSDQVERRNISRSLEREWRVNGYSDNQEDDYGFKKEFPSI
ncbi:uncharacterized protein TNCT_292411 [Trichonephila clavata]|uniref:Uncharacterized protein n=1 Tax=Trichonephila clavata TaxID=2740835 RepID=A0A8X6H6K2_TRICU|nr:uncharacterized protein TNCT_292411 [Trichonephila clavata]